MGREPTTIHEWFYRVVCETCYDREYLYRTFAEHFPAFIATIYEEGRSKARGEYHIPAIKGGLSATVEWRLAKQVSFVGSNALTLSCVLSPQDDDCGPSAAVFDLSTGERVGVK